MVKLNFLFRSLLVLGLGFPVLSAEEGSPVAELTGNDIIEKFLKKTEYESEVAFFELSVVRPGEAVRMYRLLGVYDRDIDGREGSFLRVIRPREKEGITLMSLRDQDGPIVQHIFLPAVGKSREIRGDSGEFAFLQSDFNYRDLVREIPQENRYERQDDVTILSEEMYMVKAVEKGNPMARAYQHRNLYFSKKDDYLKMVHFVGKNGKLEKVMNLEGYEARDNTSQGKRPYLVTMTDSGTGSQSSIRLIQSRLGDELNEELFLPAFQESWDADDVADFIFQLGFTVGP